MLLLALIEAHDGTGDLAHQIAAVVGRIQIQFQRQLAEQIQRRSRGPVQIEDLIQVGIERGAEGTSGSGFARADFAGEQAGAEGRLFETEESFQHDRYSSSFPSSFFCLSSSTKLMPVGSGSGEAAGLT